MKEETTKILRNTPRSHCAECNSVRTYTNPLAICHLCKYKFCFDHIWSGKSVKGMNYTDPFVELCDKCVLEANPTRDLTS